MGELSMERRIRIANEEQERAMSQKITDSIC
jgi:hypothetical protein